jgi:hypothetical protein
MAPHPMMFAIASIIRGLRRKGAPHMAFTSKGVPRNSPSTGRPHTGVAGWICENTHTKARTNNKKIPKIREGLHLGEPKG